MEDYKVSGKTLQAVINYLASKPYSETYQLISTLQASEKIEEDKE